METNLLNIGIECGADFSMAITIFDESENPVDLTGASIEAQLREYPEAVDYFDFVTSHNNSGGRIFMAMAHEETIQIPYTSGVYDVFVTRPGGTRWKILQGQAIITPNVTKPFDGAVLYVLSFSAEDYFPTAGVVNRIYFSQASNKMYRWNGTEYVSIITDGEAATISVRGTETLPAGSEASVVNMGSLLNASLWFSIPRGNGITSVSKTATDVLRKTYTITFDDPDMDPFTFDVYDGRGIQSVAEAVAGLNHTYTVTYNDGTSEAYVIKDGVSCTHAWNGTTLTITSASGTSSVDFRDLLKSAMFDIELDILSLEKQLAQHQEWAEQHFYRTITLKNFGLIDNDSYHLIDNNGSYLVGAGYFPILDDTLTSDIYPASSKKVKEYIDAADNALAERVGINEGDIADLKENVTEIENDIDIINRDIDDINRDIDDINRDIDDIESDISNINNNIGDIGLDITALTGRVSQNETDIDSLDDEIEKIEAALRVREVHLADDEGNHLINNSGDLFVGLIYMPITDDTFVSEVFPASAKATGDRIANTESDISVLQNITEYAYLNVYQNFGMPIMYLEHPDLELLKNKDQGNLEGVSCVFKYRDINTTTKVKVQGSSSAGYPKKNYTLTFDSPVSMDDNWGWHKKYCIKADWVDFSHVRNEVGAKIWKQMRRSRINTTKNRLADADGYHLIDNNNKTLAGETDPMLGTLNFGAIDAYPILLVINDKYWGIYSVTIPKDEWMVGMVGDNEHEGIVSAYSGATFKSALTSIDEDGQIYTDTTKRYDVEYVPDENNMTWVMDSLNDLINAAISATDVSDIEQYVDIDSAIDYFILLCLLDHWDGTGRNYLLDTWDGEKWYFSAYDMDNTFGYTYFTGSGFYKDYFRNPAAGYTFAAFANTSKIAYIIYHYAAATLKARYQALRNGALSEANINYLIMNYASHIPQVAYQYESLRWPTRPASNTNKWEQIIDYYRLRCSILDAEIAAL